MSITTVSDETRRARKPYPCQLCGRTIQPGESYHYQFNTDGGDSWQWRECTHCAAVISTLWNLRYDLEEIGPYYLFDTLQESGRVDLLRLAVGMKRRWSGWAGRLMPVPIVPARRCVDCSEPVDDPRSYTWCAAHEDARRVRITGQLRDLVNEFA